MITLQIKQLVSTKYATITSAEQKRICGGGGLSPLVDDSVTKHEKDDRIRNEVWQSYADGDANITSVNEEEGFTVFKFKDGSKHLFVLL